MRSNPLLLTLGSLIAAVAPLSASVIDFNSEADFIDNFDPTANYSWSSEAGVGGTSGRVNSVGNAGSGNASRTYYETPFTWDEDTDTLHFSVYFLGNAATSSTLLRQGIGISTGTTTNFLTGGSSTVGWRILKSGSSSFSLDFKYGAGGLDAITLSDSNFNLTTDDWYKIDLILTRQESSNAFSFSIALENWGSSGQSYVSTVVSAADVEFLNSGLYSAAELVGGIAVANLNGGFTAFDRFYMGAEAIPEPGETALMIAGAAALGIWMRRRRRCVPTGV